MPNSRWTARSILFDLFGDFANDDHRSASVPLTALVRLATELGLSPLAVRAAAARMVDDGWLVSERRGRERVHALTPRGRQLVDEGRERIFFQREAAWDGRWLVVVLSVPEAHREIRDRMRQRLSWLGFGSAGNAVYVSPTNQLLAVERLAAELGGAEYLSVYWGNAVVPRDARTLVARAWRALDAVNQRYAEFLHEFTPELARCRSMLAADSLADRAAFRLRVTLVNRFRKCLFDDPGLPRELLPGTWWAGLARRLFLEFHELVSPPALRYFDAACAGPARKAR